MAVTHSGDGRRRYCQTVWHRKSTNVSTQPNYPYTYKVPNSLKVDCKVDRKGFLENLILKLVSIRLPDIYLGEGENHW